MKKDFESFDGCPGLDFAGDSDECGDCPYRLKNLKHRFAKGFKAGQLSVKRRNKSGCCCIINDDDKVEVACGAHLNWRDSLLPTA